MSPKDERMQAAGPKLAVSERAAPIYTAVCHQCSEDPMSIGWQGPPRAIRIDAEIDAAEHNRAVFPHEAYVLF